MHMAQPMWQPATSIWTRRTWCSDTKPSPVDVHVGTRVRQRQTLLGKTLADLGDALGLTFQQVQKYERGTNRISSSRLYNLSQVLDVPVDDVFEDMPPAMATISPARGRGKAKKRRVASPTP